MSTRLDRLISLLETGSNAQIKSTAAKQLGEIARRTFGVGGSSIEGGARPSISPDSTTADIKPNKDALNSDTAALGSGLEMDAEWAEVMDLIGRVIPHLRSKSYDTRTAAALAIEQIAHAVPVWTPPASALSTADPSSSAATALCPEDTKPPTPFSLAPLLLPSHPKLLGSSGKEYAPPAVPTTREEIEAGKREVMKRLGIGAGAGDIDLGGMGDIVKEELAGGVSSSNPDSPANLTTGEESPAAAAVPLLSLHAKGKEKALSAAALKRQEKERMEEEKKKELAEGEAAGLSARQLNALKRKRKMGGGAATAAAPPPPVKPRLDASSPKGSSPSTSNPTTPSASNGPSSERVVIDPQAKAAARAAAEAAAEAGGAVVAPGKPSPGAALVVERDEAGRERWPWTRIVESLEVGLFSANWEVRHGSAMGLRDILKIQGAAAGTVVGYPISLNALCNSNALLAHSQSLLTLLALDRFGDFNSDQVVAPVREVAAQALAAILIHMSAESVRTVHEVLVAMVRQDWLVTAPGSNHPDKGLGYAWEVRHAGLLGLKYEVAVRGDLVAAVGAAPSEVKVEGTSSGVKVEAEDVKMEEGDALAGKTAGTMLGDVIETAILGLGDNDDDVRSVSAACLQPIAALIATQLPAELTRVSEVLWNALSEGGDELGSSTGGVMDLLGKFIAYPRYIDILKTGTLSLNDLIPRLYPFFRHTIVAVRLAVPQALHLFLTSPAIQTIDWVDARLFRFLYQNLIIEERYEIRTATLQTWVALLDKIGRTSSTTEAAEQFLEAHTKAFLGEWVAIAMSPPGVPLDANLFLKAAAMAPARVSKTGKAADAQAISHNVDKNAMAQDLSLISADEVLKNRIDAAQALALLVHEHGSEALATDLTRLILDHLGSTSAHQIVIASIIIEEWARAVDARKTAAGGSPLPEANSIALADALLVMLEGQVPTAYYEMLLILSQAYGECQGLLSAFVTDGKIPQSVIPVLPTSLDPTSPPAELFTVDVAGQVAGSTFDALVKRLGKAPAKTALPMLKERQMKIVSSIGYYMAMKDKHDRQVSAAVAGAVIALRVLPGKLNPVIRSIMNGVKLEENADIQARFANAVVSFIAFCSSPAAAIKSNPTEKIVKNLCTFLCQDITRTPVFASAKGTLEGILSDAGVATTTILRGKEVPVVESEEVMAVRVTRRGAELALAELGRRFGPRLFEAVPKLWSNISSVLIETFSPGIDAADEQLADSDRHGQDIIDSFSTLSTVAGQVDLALHDQIANLLPVCLVALQSRFAVIRYAAAHAITSLCDVATVRAMRDVVETLLPFVGDPSAVKRQGAVQAVSLIVRTLDTKALPYVIFLIVPILGRMSDPDDTVRVASTSAFAALVKLVPLEAGIPDPIGFSPEMLERRADERQFLHQLLDGSKVDQYQIPVLIKAELRKYQQDGVNWLAFLAKYQLHGILCDDMGLGKSLQSLCILASKHHERAERFKSTGSPDAVHLPSVIVCPPTLTGHWYHEILKFTENLRPVLYVGSLRDRTHLQTSLTSYDVVIMSYDVVRNDIAYLGGIHWNYCILDEGHIIKNGKTKLTQAVKMIRANYRLILSGTPIQNNVLELWSLFDFLMPGFLGTERSFNERFGKPITANRDGKATAREREAAVLALDALHKQVLPFLLRRLKEDVLADLPPKIIQDYYCDLSDVQKQLYDDFGRSTAGEQIGEIVSTSGGGKGQPHVFQSLQYLRKLCNHPCLVAQEADYPAIVSKVKATGGTAGPNSIRDLENAPKLSALKQILTDCGIGAPSLAASSEVDDLSLASAIPQHRVLIFCQLKTMLDVIEKDLFHAHMPSLSYMRMDGSTDPSKRHGVVQTFNSDPSIDVLLLTTQVGGLGLNLTGADTVIFVEHDWNPQKDLQAMDRAHRLGQKKVVNVYRLITKGTLEEKIMGLQRFKLNIANSVVNQQNAGLESMATDNVLDLFKISTGEEDAADAARKKAEAAERGGPVSQKSLLDGLEDLPAEDEYGGLGMDSFLSGLGGQS